MAYVNTSAFSLLNGFKYISSKDLELLIMDLWKLAEDDNCEFTINSIKSMKKDLSNRFKLYTCNDTNLSIIMVDFLFSKIFDMEFNREKNTVKLKKSLLTDKHILSNNDKDYSILFKNVEPNKYKKNTEVNIDDDNKTITVVTKYSELDDTNFNSVINEVMRNKEQEQKELIKTELINKQIPEFNTIESCGKIYIKGSDEYIKKCIDTYHKYINDDSEVAREIKRINSIQAEVLLKVCEPDSEEFNILKTIIDTKTNKVGKKHGGIRKGKSIGSYDDSGKLIERYISLDDAINCNQELNINKQVLMNSLNKNKKYKGYYWKHIEL